jgi:hypothetical protein
MLIFAELRDKFFLYWNSEINYSADKHPPLEFLLRHFNFLKPSR